MHILEPYTLAQFLRESIRKDKEREEENRVMSDLYKSLLGMGIREGDNRLGYCHECQRENPDQEELWRVSDVGVFYCTKHLEEIIELD